MNVARTRQRRIAIFARDYVAYVRSLMPALWFRLNELSGAVAVNSGTLGAAFNGTYTACTLGQAGKIGPASAVLFDGVNSKIEVPAGAHGAYAQFSVAVLGKFASAGENNMGDFYEYGANATASRFADASRHVGAYRQGTGNASSLSTDVVPTATWIWIFITFDNTGTRKTEIYLGRNSAAPEVSYSTHTAMTGTLTDLSATGLTIGNRTNQVYTTDGLLDEFLLFNTVLTPAQLQQIVRLTGV